MSDFIKSVVIAVFLCVAISAAILLNFVSALVAQTLVIAQWHVEIPVWVFSMVIYALMASLRWVRR